MSIAPSLPVPPDDWLEETNQRYRGEDMPPGKRPFSALKEWAKVHDQATPPRPFLLHLDSEAWRKIYTFFRTNTKLGQESGQPLRRAAWFYDGSFYQISLGVRLGSPRSSATVNAFDYLAKTMPIKVLQDLSRDEPRVQEYLEHLAHALEILQLISDVEARLTSPLAKRFLISAEQHLASAVDSLLATPPNGIAAHLCRLSFECSLKALLGEKGGLTDDEAKRISHYLDRLFEQVAARCANLVPPDDFTRIGEAANGIRSSAGTREIFPGFGARYEGKELSNRELWECYRAAQHALATVLRALGDSDSRELN